MKTFKDAQCSTDPYRVDNWGAGYFSVNSRGNVARRLLNGEEAHAFDDEDPRLELQTIAEKIRDAGIAFPVLCRFPDILKHRVRRLGNCFTEALNRRGIDQPYTPIYPIKTNQDRHVVTSILDGAPGGAGLEAGSKAELMAALSELLHYHSRKTADRNTPTLICNGYKDGDYIRLAFYGMELGVRVIIVIEQLRELDEIIRVARQMNAMPVLGVRLRLAATAPGNWQNTGGEAGKFGLRPDQVLRLLEELKRTSMLSCLQLLHFHMGSQISRISAVRAGIREAARWYQELILAGTGVSMLNVGGGLAVDYTGGAHADEFSMDYTLQEYADCIVDELAAGHHDFPTLFSESGRALSAHHAVLLTDVVDVEEAPRIPDAVGLYFPEPWEGPDDLRRRRTEYHRAFLAGELTLRERAAVEESYGTALQMLIDTESELAMGAGITAWGFTRVFCNFSVFQSLPDAWALKQIFPVLPLTGHGEPMTHQVLIEDLTCDSDGRLTRYAAHGQPANRVPMRSLQVGEALAFFLVGAYQEILGDKHNLFGQVNKVGVVFEDGQVRLETPRPGEGLNELLNSVNYDATAIEKQFADAYDAASVPEHTASARKADLRRHLRSYSYLLRPAGGVKR